ncbi:cell wall hydrolase [Paracoccus fistulariae]|uniref:cell wall hydrolase n=1 Tax=Paracoccus fistulariae TaxID=658446 RepID=UPI002FE45B31
MKVENLVVDEDSDTPRAELFLASSRNQFSEQDLSCLSEALYHEARGEGARGQAAVAEVILNRVDSRRFPRTVCGVVNQPSQFSYTIGGRKPIRNKAAYLRARAIAENALAGAPRVLTGGATYFHTPAVRPAWSRRFQRTVRIGQHIFYRRGGQRVASN